MLQGAISYYNEERGFGFINSADSLDYFFHITSISGKSEFVSVGARVEFLGQTHKGKLRATDVSIAETVVSTTNPTSKRRRTEYTPNYTGPIIELDNQQTLTMLAEVSNWKLEAKLENSKKYFSPVPELAQITAGAKAYVIGRKGTGKTAIVSHLSETTLPNTSSSMLSFKNFPFNELYRLHDQQYTKPNQYITLWKYIIYSTVVRMMAKSPSMDPLLQKKILKVYPEPDASDLKGLLKRWTAGDFSLNILGTGFSFANWFSKQTDTNWIDRVGHLEEFVIANCDTSTFLILFDELDEDYKDIMNRYRDGEYIPLLTSLFKATQDVRAVMDRKNKKIFPVIFLRDDIFDLITDSDKTKWRDFTTQLDWSLPDIKRIMKHRIEVASGLKSDDFLQVWHMLFDSVSIPYAAGRKSLHSLDYITRSTHGRPRDYIHYLQVCASSQLENGGGRISERTTINADKTYSNYLKSELTDEIHGIVPDILNVFRVLSQIRKWILSVEEFSEVFESYSKKGQISIRDAGFVLQTLFYFSVIGNVSRNNQIHIFRHEHPDAVLNFNEKLVIHRGLMKSLQIL